MPRITKAEREASELLQAYNKAQNEVKYATKELERLKVQVEALDPGAYAGWEKTYGEPRELLDQQAVRELCAKHKITVPMKATKAPLIVKEIR